MACLLVVFAVAFPRIILLLVFLFSNYLGRAYHGVLIPLVGFVFLPLTTLAYAFAINAHGSVDGVYLGLVIVAALIDLGILGKGEAHRRRRG